jgi:organic hydroperoxide reductase OsmC/OhrA
MQLARFAPLYDVVLEDASADVRGVFDGSDKYGLEGSGGAFEQVLYKVEVVSPSPVEQVRRLLEHAERACHTAQSLRNPVSVALEVQLNGEPLAPS